MNAEFERLAYEAALRGLDKQEKLLEELRARTGVLLAASSLAASFLGTDAFGDSAPVAVAVAALAGFLLSVAASLYILTPKATLIFAQAGAGLYEGLYAVRGDMAEVYRRLAYDLDRFWDRNDTTVVRLLRAFRVAAGALVAEIVLLVALVTDTIFQAMATTPQPTPPPPPPPPTPGLGRPETRGGSSNRRR